MAHTLNNSLSRIQEKLVNATQFLAILLGMFLLLFLTIISKTNLYFTVFCLLMFVFIFIKMYHIKLNNTIKLVLLSGFTSLVINFYASVKVYTKVSQYRAGIYVAEYLNKNYKLTSVAAIGKIPNLFDFYSNSPVIKYKTLPKNEPLKSEFVLSFLIDSLSTQEILKHYKVEKRFKHYNEENIQLKFFYPKQRKKNLTEFVLYKRENANLKIVSKL